MADWASNFINPLIGGLPIVIQALILLLLALIAASVARAVVKKIMNSVLARRTKNDEELVTKKDTADLSNLVGNIVYAIVFLLFLPGALDKLGLTNVSQPLATMATTFLNFLPNIIAACIIIIFGVFLSKLVKQILLRILRKTKIDSWQERCGIESKPGAGFSDIIANVIYAIILIIFVVAGLQILNITAISQPATSMVNQIFNIIPSLFVAIILIAVGAFIARLTANVLGTVLAGTGMDAYVRGALPNKNGKPSDVAASKIICDIVRVVINIFFIVTALKLLNIQVLSDIGTAIIGYMPQVLAAVLVLIAAWLLATWAEKEIVKASPNAKNFAHAVNIFIIVIAAFMILSQLGIAPKIVNTLFLALAIAFAAAMAIAFGVGGRDWAKRILEKQTKNVEDQLETKKDSEK
jgi:small-conductance mechanosensitive channel